MLYIEIGLDNLTYTGYGNPYQHRVYELTNDGILQRPLHTEICCQHGESKETQLLKQYRHKKLLRNITKQREEENRLYYKNKKQGILSKAQQIIEANREMMANFGPVVIK